MLPIRLEAFDDLRHPSRIVRHHPVVARLGEILQAEVECGDEGAFPSTTMDFS